LRRAFGGEDDEEEWLEPLLLDEEEDEDGSRSAFYCFISLCSFKSFSSSACKLCSSLSSELDELLEDCLRRIVYLLKSPSKAGFVSGPASKTSFDLRSGFLASVVRLGL